jgi:CxxC-x17-CxxC domain-containing protein
MEFQDRRLNCVDCGAEFIWTAGEQLFYADKNFKNEPKRCRSCKSKRAARPVGPPPMRERVETAATCSACGKETTVPFKPTQGRPVFCRDCFQQRKVAGATGA